MANPSPAQPGAYSVKGFCEAYAVGCTFVYAEISAGRLRAVKAGHRTLILAADAAKWAAALPALGEAS